MNTLCSTERALPQLRGPARTPCSPFRPKALPLLGFERGRAGDNEDPSACLEGGRRIWAAARAVPAS